MISNIDNIVFEYETRTKFLSILAEHFHESLLNNEEAYQYCRYTRKLTDKALLDFNIGYDESGASLEQFLNSQGIDAETLTSLGVLTLEADNRYYDKFAKRIIFPVYDIKGNINAFSGRVFKKEDNRSKYVTSNLSSIFQKSFNLYGLYQNLSSIIKHRTALVIEGNIDVNMCYQNDIRISVSPLGTAFMEDHVKVLKLFIDTIIFCFDKDVAGEKAENRVKEMLKHDNDLRLGFMHLPGEEKDPDSFIKTYGKEAFIEALCAVKNGIGY